MAVTVDSAAIVGGGSGNTGWSARSLFHVNETDSVTVAPGAGTQQDVGISGATTAAAQSFSPSSSYALDGVLLPLNTINTPSDNWYLEIHTDATNVPSGTVLATSNVIASSAFSNSNTCSVRFTFPSPPSLTSSTKYWIVMRRSGSVDGSNYMRWKTDTANPYASHGMSLFNGTSWGSEHATTDLGFVLITTDKVLYLVSQDSALHVWKSGDNGASWTEQDNANAPTVNSSTKPFSADYQAGLILEQGAARISVAYFTNTNTVSLRFFNTVTDLWITSDFATATTDADFNRNVRVLSTSFETDIFYTSVADDADLEYVRATTGAFGAQTQTLVITSTEASCYSDVTKDRTKDSITGSRFLSMWYHEVNADDFEVRTLTGTTLGTATDVDATAADVETEHASAVYQVYDDAGTDKAIVAFIDADGTLEEKVCSLGVTSASITQGSQHQVSAGTGQAGRSLATCKFGSDLYIFASTSATAIDYWVDVGATGTWSSVVNWKTGLTAAVLSTAVPIAGVGILVSYVDNGNVVVELLVPSFPATGTATVGTASAAGGTHTATGIANQTGTTTVGTAAAAGGTHSATAGAIGTATVGTAPASGGTHTGLGVANQTGTSTVGTSSATGGSHSASVANTGTTTVGTAAASGGDHTASAATVGAHTVGTAPAAGGSHTGTAQRHETGTHTASDAAATGHAATGTAGAQDSGTHTVGTAPAAGGTHTGSYVAHQEGTATVGTCAAAGGTHTGTAGASATGTTTVGEATAEGGAHTGSFVANLTGTATVGTAAAAGGDHSAFAAGADEGAHIRGTATADGGTHTGIVTASATTVTGTASAAGGTHSGAYGATGTHTVGDAVASGGTHTGSFGITSTAVVGTATATGGDHTGTSGTTGALVVGTATAIGGEHLAGDGSAVDATGNAIVGTATATGETHTAVVIMPSIIIYTIRHRSPAYTISHPVDEDEYTISRSSDEYTVRRR